MTCVRKTPAVAPESMPGVYSTPLETRKRLEDVPSMMPIRSFWMRAVSSPWARAQMPLCT